MLTAAPVRVDLDDFWSLAMTIMPSAMERELLLQRSFAFHGQVGIANESDQVT